MKKACLILTGVLIVFTTVNGQYKFNKTKYNITSYSYKIGDPYKPSNAGFASLIIPGLGQMISGEAGRGFGFLSGFAGCLGVSFIGMMVSLNASIDEHHFNEGLTFTGLGIMAAGFIGAVSIDLWSVSDAVKVAKVNNMAYRDRRKTSYNISIDPFINTSDYGLKKISPLNLTIKVNF